MSQAASACLRALRPGLWLVLASLGSVCLPATARQVVLVDPPYQRVQSVDGSMLGDAQVEAAIRDGARNQGWRVVASESGLLRLRLVIRNYASVVQVRHDAQGFDIDYVSSTQLEAEDKGGTLYIHPSYNKWIGELADAIRTSTALQADSSAQANAALNPAVRTTQTLSAPVLMQQALLYRRGGELKPIVEGLCPRKQGYPVMTQYFSQGLVKLTRQDIDGMPGQTLRATVEAAYATHGYVGPTMVTVSVELFDNGKLIGERTFRRETMRPLSASCDALENVEEALAEDTVNWLRGGVFEARLMTGN